MGLKKHKSIRILLQLLLVAADVVFVSFIYYILIFYRYDAAFESHFNPYALLVILTTTLIAHFITGAYHTSTDMRDFRFMGEFLIAAVVNLLIAQMSDTYTQVKGESLSFWLFERAGTV